MTFVSLVFNAFFILPTASADAGDFCVHPVDEVALAERIHDECHTGGKSVNDILKDILIEDDSDGPGYKDLFLYYKKEDIGSQILFKTKTSTPHCWVEKDFEFNCPMVLSRHPIIK